MKLNITALVLTTFCATSNVYAACESVMGGCAKEATHDTSSHMKSQIVNKVIHEEAITASAKPASGAVKSQQKTANGSKNASKSLVQAVNKVSVR